MNVAAAADEILFSREFHNAASDLTVAVADDLHDLVDGHAVSAELVRIHVDLVLLHKSADGCHFRNARDALQEITHVPVVERSQLSEIVRAGFIDERVLKSPPDTGCVGTKAG